MTIRPVVAALAGVLVGAGTAGAQPVQLFERGAPDIRRLHDPSTGAFSIPEGDWRAFSTWARSGAAPSGVPIAYLDSGVLTAHPFIRPLLQTAIDLTGEGLEDEIGHGTFVALIGILGAQMPGSTPTYSPIISIKVAGRTPRSDGTTLLIEGLRRAQAAGARVANLSAGVDLGCVNARDPAGSPFLPQCEDTPICRAVTEAERGGMLVVAAVGNMPGITACPACCRDALAVGASDRNGRQAPYSGAFPDILAPGSVREIPMQELPIR